jgi:four helix bundle protein
MIRSYRDLIVWQKGMDLVVEVYRLTRGFPDTERFGLATQLQRCACAIPSNLAEGHERRSRGDFRRHVSIARGSLAEVETQLEVARRIGIASDQMVLPISALAGEVGRMLTAMLRSLQRSP